MYRYRREQGALHAAAAEGQPVAPPSPRPRPARLPSDTRAAQGLRLLTTL
jgi:hypothetical protein